MELGQVHLSSGVCSRKQFRRWCRLVESDRSSDAKHTWAPLQKSSQRERETYWEKERDQDTKGERGAQKARACRRRRGAGDIWQRRKAEEEGRGEGNQRRATEPPQSSSRAIARSWHTIRVEDGYSPGTPVAKVTLVPAIDIIETLCHWRIQKIPL